MHPVSQHGSHFVKLEDYESAGKALQIALKSTDACLSEVRHELEEGPRRRSKAAQILHNLETELVVVSIEAFYLLSVSYMKSGSKGKALMCLDRIERYMSEQHARDDELYSNVMDRLSSGEDVFSEGGAVSALEGECPATTTFLYVRSLEFWSHETCPCAILARRTQKPL